MMWSNGGCLRERGGGTGGGWGPETMFLEGAVAIGNLDLCQRRREDHLHVFKSCMNDSL